MPAPIGLSLPPPWLAEPSRRRVLTGFGIGGLVLLGGGWVLKTIGRFGPAAPGWKVFDKAEFPILEKICETIFPGKPDWPYSAAEIGVPHLVDDYVAGLYPDTQELFRMLVRTLNLAPVVVHGRSFYWLPHQTRQQVLNDWRTSDLRVRRAGYQSINFAVKMAYYEDERVRAAAGLRHGCDLSQRPPPRAD